MSDVYLQSAVMINHKYAR